MFSPTPIKPGNLREWIAQTRALDDQLYRPSDRPARGWLRRRLPRVRRPLFVIGAPRSGTSFLGDACGALDCFSYHYEPPLTKAAGRYVYEGLWRPWLCRLVYRATYAWLVARHRDGDLRFAEKTPQNCFQVPFLAATFPDAQFLHIVRDGRDAALSYAAKKWLTQAGAGSGRRESGGYPLGPYPRYWVEPERHAEFAETGDVHRCVWAWRRHVEAALAGLAGLPAARQLQVRYEQLVADPRGHARRILGFLAIDDDASRERLEGRLAGADPRSAGRWRSELTPADAAAIDREAGALLRQLGYATATEAST